MSIDCIISQKDASRLHRGDIVMCGEFRYTVVENCEEDGKVTIQDGFGGRAAYKYEDFPYYGFTKEGMPPTVEKK